MVTKSKVLSLLLSSQAVRVVLLTSVNMNSAVFAADLVGK